MFKNTKTSLRATLLSLSVFIVACSGDGRPFQEAVETYDLQLKSISISQPSGLLDTLVVNAGTKIPFSVIGQNQDGKDVDLSGSNRRWSVSPAGAGTIDGNGMLTTVANNENLVVSVEIGRFSASFPVAVQNETLESINEIVGAASLERCVPKEYSVTGNFSLGSVRGLPNAQWDVADPAIGFVGSLRGGVVPVTGVNVGTLQLLVAQGDVTGQTSIDVENTLQEIDITPTNLAVQTGNTLNLGATGRYLKDGSERTVAITKSVQWLMPEDNGFATVGNALSNKGVVRTIAVGNSRVTASCGDIITQKALAVIERGTTSTTDLSISGGSPRTISLSAGAVQLRASTGTTYNSANDISTSDDTKWEVTVNDDVVRFGSTAQKNTLEPLKTGTATIRVTYNSVTETLEIQVNP